MTTKALKARRAELEELSLDYLYEQFREAGIDIDCSRFTKAELIDQLLEAEGHGSEPEPEPAEPSEPEP